MFCVFGRLFIYGPNTIVVEVKSYLWLFFEEVFVLFTFLHLA